MGLVVKDDGWRIGHATLGRRHLSACANAHSARPRWHLQTRDLPVIPDGTVPATLQGSSLPDRHLLKEDTV